MGACSQLTNTPWRTLYVAALFEADTAALPDKIAQAEAALVRRARELFYAPGDHIDEEEALDDAMYALQALRNAVQNGRQTPESDGMAA